MPHWGKTVNIKEGTTTFILRKRGLELLMIYQGAHLLNFRQYFNCRAGHNAYFQTQTSGLAQILTAYQV